MSQSTSSAEIILLCARDTAQRPDLADKAAEKGASIAEMHTFGTGDVASCDDLTEVPAVVTALKRALETRRDVWVPFPGVDFGREQHLRRLSLVLQRHGLDLLLGRELASSPTTGGFSAVDHALRVEVHAVDDLDQTVLAAVGVTTLSAEIERELTAADEGDAGAIAVMDDQSVATYAVGERCYSTAEVAKFFGKSDQWCYWAMRNNMFTRPDGSIIEPNRLGKRGKWRFTTPLIREMARSWYRRGNLSANELEEVLTALSQAEKH